MDNTALHTFLFHCPAALRSLVLLGSWDNFSKSYPLELDARRGRSYWRGCFTFSDIICDGDMDQHSPKRDGLLKMGGTYWYYYKVDDDDECHNPSEPSTTFCPLLPGQRLNVLELPTEGHSRTNSTPSDGFTRNPNDRYLNPVPPAHSQLLPQNGKATTNTYPLSPPSPWHPQSATYPPSDNFLSPKVVRHARSASASPRMPSAPLFTDLKCLKEKLAYKRSASRSRTSSKPQELEIGMPVLVSTTVENLELIPLGSFGPIPKSAPIELPSNEISVTKSAPTTRNGFSPLGSHPVQPGHNSTGASKGQTVELGPSHRLRRSHVPSTIITSECNRDRGRLRANSTDTRGTRHLFSNDPWLSTPKIEGSFELDASSSAEALQPVTTLQRPSLVPPSVDTRPTSSHGCTQSPSLRLSPLDKELPELPRYLKPAPLFACNNLSPVESSAEESFLIDELTDEEDDEAPCDLLPEYEEKPSSHFSMWSSESTVYHDSTSEDEGISSPTFSSLTSNDSDVGSSPRLSLRYSYAKPQSASQEGESPTLDDGQMTPHLSMMLPRLDDLRVSAFGSDLFSIDTQHTDSASRRQAACFGLDFQYSLPEDDTCSKTTIKAPELRPDPSVQRDSSVSQLNQLMNDFGYLGDAVV